jgi:hypothetical protein
VEEVARWPGGRSGVVAPQEVEVPLRENNGECENVATARDSPP